MHCAPNLPAVRTRLQQGPHDRAAASSGLGDFAVFPAEVVDMVLTCLDSSGRKAMHLVCQRLRWALMRQHIQELGYLGAMLHAVDKLLPHVQPAAGNLIQHPLLPHPPQQAALDPAVQQEVAAAVPAAQPAANQAPPVAAPEAQQGELAQLQPAAYAAQQEPPDPPADGEPLSSDAEDDDDGPPPLLPWNQFQAAEEPSLKVVVKAEVQQGSRHTELQHVQGSEVQRKYTEDMLLRCMLQEPQLTQQWQIMEQKLEAACQQFTQRTRLQMQQQLQLEEQQRMQQHSDCAEDERKDASASDCDDNAAAAEAATVPAEQTWTLMDYLPGVHRVYSHPMSNQVCVNFHVHVKVSLCHAEAVQKVMLQGGIVDFLERLMPCTTTVRLELAGHGRFTFEAPMLRQSLHGRQRPELAPGPDGNCRGLLLPSTEVLPDVAGYSRWLAGSRCRT